MSPHWKAPLLHYLFLFLLAALPRAVYGLAVLGHPGQGYKGDEMERAAVFLVLQGEIANVYSSDSGPSAHVTPLYACFLAGLYSIFGLPDAGGWIAQVLAASLATAAGITLLPLLGQRLGFHPWAGWVAGVCLALSPVNLWVESWGGWEQPFAVLALLGLLFAFLSLHDRWRRSTDQSHAVLIAATGLLIGVCALLSPAVLPAAGLMLLAEFWTQAQRRRRVMLAATAMVVIGMACVAPWAYRNYQVLGGFVPIRSNFGLELWIGNNDQANGKTFVTYFDDPHRITRGWHPAGSANQRVHLKEVGELAYMKEKQSQALDWIAHHPGRFVELTANRFRYYWFPAADLWTPNAPLQGLRVWIFGISGLGALAGLVYLIGSRHRSRWLVAAAVMGPSLVYLITHVDSRYRYPTLALSVLLGCQAILWSFHWLYRAVGEQVGGAISAKALRKTVTPGFIAGRKVGKKTQAALSVQ